jgi:hypothetical protein
LLSAVQLEPDINRPREGCAAESGCLGGFGTSALFPFVVHQNDGAPCLLRDFAERPQRRVDRIVIPREACPFFLQQWAQEKCQRVNNNQCQLEFSDGLFYVRQVNNCQGDWGNEDILTVSLQFSQTLVPNGKVFKGDNANPPFAARQPQSG